MDLRIRKQNHSCDQCRKSKKACDGYWVNRDHSQASPNSAGSDTPNSSSPTELLPCSYCSRTQNKCSLNQYWWNPCTQASHSSPSSSTLDQGNEATRTKRQKLSDHALPTTHVPLSEPSYDSSEVFNALLRGPSLNQQSFHCQQSFHWDESLPGIFEPLDPPTNESIDSFRLGIALDPAAHLQSNPHTDTPHAPLEPTNETHHSLQARHGSFSNSTVYSGMSDIGMRPDVFRISPSYMEEMGRHRLPLSTDYHQDVCDQDHRTRRQSETGSRLVRCSPSPFGVDHVIMTSVNNHLITDSLLRIYHDVVENNLACWLSEDTCPYNMRSRKRELRAMLSFPELQQQEKYLKLEYGASWTNRMYRRVIQLDRAAQSARMIRLTRAESKAASRALSVVIMAFATQWSQGQRRRPQHQSSLAELWDPNQPNNDDDDDDDINEGFKEEFEDNIQQSVWQQAKRALDEVAHVESYRVVYAELIFGLVQKPSQAEEEAYAPDDGTSIRGSGDGSDQGCHDQTASKVMDIVSASGPHTYMERATRRIHALKYRFDANESGLRGEARVGQKRSLENSQIRVTGEDKSTIGLLYWLAVMFDTVSSSMDERPVALVDEECQHDEVQKQSSETTLTVESARIANRWETNLFVQDNIERPSATIRWPCSYDEASDAVARSAPVKILLFRYVSYLQNALRKKEHGRPVEDIIRGAMLLYRYWNKTYGALVRDLIRDYDNVPARLKSWFVCIAIPWHLGALMLADLIDSVDSNCLGLAEKSHERISAKTMSTVRKASASELADLARVTTPSENDNSANGQAQLPDLHFAVNQGSLLTEPWTILLIRAFTKAALIYVKLTEDLQKQEASILGYESDEFQDNVRRAENCVKGLWFLGRKSEMARSVAGILSRTLKQGQV